MSVIRLLSTDFDGTLIGFGSDGKCSPAFAAALARHHREGGLWALNTGRTVEHAVDGIVRFEGPVVPDFLLTLEREVYQRGDGGEWIPHGEWNALCEKMHSDLFLQSGEIFSFVRQLAIDREGVNIIYENDNPVGIVTETEDIMHAVVDDLLKESSSQPHFSFQRNTIYLRFCHKDYNKGTALAELCRLEGFSPEEVFAAGDHYNDMSMLNGVPARMVACPANAIDPVKDLVRSANGYVAEKPWADGIAEALDYFTGASPALKSLTSS